MKSQTKDMVIAGMLIILIVLGGLWFTTMSSNRELGKENPTAHNSSVDSASTAHSTTPLPTSENTEPEPRGSCEDVTSYDYNWDNDMLCTRPDGSTFYTDYSGARAYEESF